MKYDVIATNASGSKKIRKEIEVKDIEEAIRWARREYRKEFSNTPEEIKATRKKEKEDEDK